MSPISRFQPVKQAVRDYFNKSTQNIFSLEDLAIILDKHRGEWHLSSTTDIEKFEKQLIQSKVLYGCQFEFGDSVKPKHRFWPEKAEEYDVILSLISGAHFSHAAALFLHGLVKNN